MITAEPALGPTYDTVILRIATFVVILTGASVTHADWAWRSGDIAFYDAASISSSLQERVLQSIDAGLDWVALAAPSETGAFVGLGHFVQEVELNVPRVIPIVGAAWRSGNDQAVLLGVDPRSPLPHAREDLLAVATSQSAVTVFTHAREEGGLTPVFTARNDNGWAESTEVDGEWDRILRSGRRCFIASTSGGVPGQGHRTYAWSKSHSAEGVIEALRRGAAYVAEKDGIRVVTFEVQGASFGGSAVFDGEAYIRMQAYARDPISRVALIADGQVVWATSPNTCAWSERFFLPLHGRRYVRLVLESEAGGYRTIGNPVFLVTDRLEASGEIPFHDVSNPGDRPFIELGGIIEASAQLEGAAQVRILAEFLSSPDTRFPTVWLLQDRGDLVTDDALRSLLGHEDAEVRLGAAYALLTRRNAAFLVELLDDPSSRVRTYAARIVAQYTEGFDQQDWRLPAGEDPLVTAYTVRAYLPNRYQPDHVAQIVGLMQHENLAVAVAAEDKIVSLGSRDYRVIRALQDSADEGNIAAIGAIGKIGDHRSVAPLLEIFRREPYGAQKRAAFDALARLNVPYQGRSRIDVPILATTPSIDGVLDALLEAKNLVLANDEDATPVEQADAVVARVGDSLYVFASTNVSGRPPTRMTEAPVSDAGFEIVVVPAAEESPSTYRFNALALGGNRSGGCRAASRLVGDTWSVEALIPLREVGRAPVARFNLFALTLGRDRLAWNVTYGAPNNPDRFGEIHFDSPQTGGRNE